MKISRLKNRDSGKSDFGIFRYIPNKKSWSWIPGIRIRDPENIPSRRQLWFEQNFYFWSSESQLLSFLNQKIPKIGIQTPKTDRNL